MRYCPKEEITPLFDASHDGPEVDLKDCFGEVEQGIYVLRFKDGTYGMGNLDEVLELTAEAIKYATCREIKF